MVHIVKCFGAGTEPRSIAAETPVDLLQLRFFPLTISGFLAIMVLLLHYFLPKGGVFMVAVFGTMGIFDTVLRLGMADK